MVPIRRFLFESYVRGKLLDSFTYRRAQQLWEQGEYDKSASLIDFYEEYCVQYIWDSYPGEEVL